MIEPTLLYSNTKRSLDPVKCSVCGKIFVPAVEHLYKKLINRYGAKDKKCNKTTYQCSYTCWRKVGGDGGYGKMPNGKGRGKEYGGQ